ncbi:MAG: hypothetical protein ACKPCP_20150 [Sphaerospermopsis kisseleviana]
MNNHSVTQEFTDYVTSLGLKIDCDPRCSYAPITLYVELGNSRQAYKHFASEEEAMNHIKNGCFFGYQGWLDPYINKFPDRCYLDVGF